MGRKTKIGKRRKDKFYYLARETGYRARSAFKLIQLNRKFQFLQRSRVLVDLCAAPGGWLQVAAKFMPISSLIIGVDLVPIKPIPNVITFQEDITSQRCRQQLQRELKTWKVDCMLNDGAPNVGSAWVQDAFSQVELTLAALKLACEFLKEGGWFITKVFRSKDYQPLMWVFQQLFKKVNSTKPQASRIESAEIFVVCQGYLAPSKVDPKLLDPKYVFQEIEDEEKQSEQKISLTRLQKPSKVAEGYPDDARILFKAVPVADFITADNHLTLLSQANKLVFDKTSEVFARHPLTTDEIKICCEDTKVLGPRELKQLVKWREKMRKFLDEVGSDKEGSGEEGVEHGEGVMDRIDAKVKALENEEAAELKREKRRLRRQKRKLKERLVNKGDFHRESGELIRQEDLFNLKNIKSQDHLDKVEKGEMNSEEVGVSSEGEESETMENADTDTDEELEDMDRENENSEDFDASEQSSIEDNDSEVEEDMSKPQTQEESNPLLVTLDSTSTAGLRLNRSKLWFSKSVFENLENENDEDTELQQMVQSYKNKGGKLWMRQEPGKESNSGNGTQLKSELNHEQKDASVTDLNGDDKFDTAEQNISQQDSNSQVHNETSSSSSDSDTSDNDSDNEDLQQVITKARVNTQRERSGTENSGNKRDDNSFKVVPVSQTQQSRRKLDPEGLAIGSLMVQSKKKREEIIEGAYNRWTNDDSPLPDWFAADEAKFCQKRLPISKEMADIYRAKLREIDARPIKKIAEAKARKKKRAMKKLEKARKKAEGITDAADVSSHEKAQQIKQVYKKAGVLGKRKKEVEYVVAKRGVGKRVRRPAGVKGVFKVVDPRMKKDNRGKKQGGRQKQRGRRKH